MGRGKEGREGKRGTGRGRGVFRERRVMKRKEDAGLISMYCF